MKTLDVKLVFIEELLGTASADPEVYDRFIASKAPFPAARIEEVSNIPLSDEAAGRTVFPRGLDGRPIAYDYHVKGFFKDACSMLRRVKGTESAKRKAFKKEIDGLIFVGPREIPILFDGEVGQCQRPLRASTPMGERVALACSETAPAGATMEFAVMLLDDALEPAVREWLAYGELRGLGQWRNSGKGRFRAEVRERAAA